MWIVLFVILLIWLLGWRFDKKPTTFGSARWLTIFEAFSNGLFRKKGLLVGDWVGLLPVYYDGTHAITYAASGTGKGTTAIIPNLLQYPHIFVNDSGGENTAVAIRAWRARGARIYVINPFGEHQGLPWSLPAHAFNPLDFVPPASPSFIADAEVLAKMLVLRTGKESSSSRYFIDTAENWIAACIVHVMTAEPPARRNLGTIYDYAHYDAGEFSKLLSAMKANRRYPLVRAMALTMEKLDVDAPAQYWGVMGSVQQALHWLAEPRARAAVSRSEVDFTELKRPGPGTVISLVLPIDYKESHAAVSRLAIQSAVWAMTRGTPSPHRVLFEIDECASLGRIERLPQWLAELRKYKVQFSLHFQGISQPRILYQEEADTFQANCQLKRFFGVGDLKTALEAHEFCGTQTIVTKSRGPGGVSTSESARDLLKREDVIWLRDHEQLVLIRNLRPRKIRRTAYWDRPEFAGLYNSNPFMPDGARPSLLLPLRRLQGRIAYTAAWWLTPHPAAAAIICGGIALGIARLFWG